MIRKIFSFTPKKLRNTGFLLGLVSMLLAIGLAAYLSLFKHIVTDWNSFFLVCIPAVPGSIALLIWPGSYEIPKPVTSSQSSISVPFTATTPFSPPTNQSFTPQEEEKRLPGQGSSGRSDKPTRIIPNTIHLPSQPTNNTQASEPTYPLPDNNTQAIRPTYTPPIYGPLDTIHLPPETFPLEQETHSSESSATRQLQIPDIPTLEPITQSISLLNVREFVYPKEGKKPENSQDKFAYFCQGGRCRFAVADGVGNSFLPNEWAQILTNNFVTRNEDFKDSEDFVPWLIACSRQWYTWVDEQWIPIVQQRLNRYIDWSRDRARGAQATFIGCSFDATPLAQRYPAHVNVMTIGDSVLFHLQPPGPSQEQWRYSSYPSIKPEEFGPIPYTLATRSDLIEQAWQTAQIKSFDFAWGDIILLTTDALAKWIVMDTQRIPTLLAMRNKEAFGDFVLRERNEGTLELDDVTLLIIYLQ